MLQEVNCSMQNMDSDEKSSKDKEEKDFDFTGFDFDVESVEESSSAAVPAASAATNESSSIQDENYCKEPVQVEESEDEDCTHASAVGHTFDTESAKVNAPQIPSVFSLPLKDMGSEITNLYLRKLQRRRQVLTLLLRKMAQRNYEDEKLVLTLMYGEAPLHTTVSTPECSGQCEQ